MTNTFNEYSPATTSIEVKNVPIVAGLLKSAMMGYKYAPNCEWYATLSDAKSVKEIFDIFNIKFELKENRFYPVVKDIPVHVAFKTVLENIAPYMNDGDLIVQDDYHVYTLKFRAGKITGTRRKVGDIPATTTPQVVSPAPVNTTPNKPVKTSNKGKASTPKKYGKTEVRSNTKVATVQERSDNRYTIEEISKELIRQILNGNGGKYIEVKGECLFKSITKTA
jgi:hypothetical protein